MNIDFTKYKIIKEPVKHILVNSSKKLHGWWPGKRECSCEKMLINPYNGCSVNCFFCYANNFQWGYFKHFKETGTITVCKNYDLEVAKQLDRLNVAACGYLSPMTDPFQQINNKYHLSDKIIKVFIDRNIPISFTTKCLTPDNLPELISKQKHSFAQFSIITPRKDLIKHILGSSAANSDDLFNEIKKYSPIKYLNSDQTIHTVCRIDPIIPYITSARDDLKELIKQAVSAGARHIIASCLDIPVSAKNLIIKRLYQLNANPDYAYEKLFCENIGGSLHAHINFRKKLFSFLREETQKQGISFALCMEYEKNKPYIVNIGKDKTKKVSCHGLNKEFMTSSTCEGINVPIYIREGENSYIDSYGKTQKTFIPAANSNQCNGNCLNCKKAVCGVQDLAMGRSISSQKNFEYGDYRRWSKLYSQHKF